MQNFRTFLFSVLLLCISLVCAQDTKPSFPLKKFSGISQLVKINPLPILWGPIMYTSEYRLNSEFTTSHTQSMEIGFSYLGKNIFLWMVEDSLNNNQGKYKINGYRFQLEYRFFPVPFTSSPDGFYFAPHLSYSNALITMNYLVLQRQFVEIAHFNINLKLGYELILDENKTFDFFIGMGYKKNRWWEIDGDKRIPMDISDQGIFYTMPLKLTLGFNFGFAF
ncbi:MAG: DUF3575 domain-containing protein [Bacteroidota bacterium]